VKHTRTNLLRRIVMWVAGVVLVASVAALGASTFRLVWTPRPSFGIALRDGCLHTSNIAVLVEEPHWGILDKPAGRLRFSSPRWERWRWLPVLNGRGWAWLFALPLWMPASCAMSVLAIGARLGTVRHRKLDAARSCIDCHYDLTGITGPCPECGKERGA
jgi:hypothetical protein